MNDILEFVKTVWPIVVPTTAILSWTGLIPRIGPGRAVWIAFRSRLAPKKIARIYKSCRTQTNKNINI